jgi:hypothetical protein
MNDVFDTEFKLYLHNKGINVDSNIFDVKFNPPQNFAAFRQTEMDTARVTTYTTVAAVPFISKRFALKRFLGLTQEEIVENETMWKEENVDDDTELPANAELRSVGITANGMGSDMSALSGATSAPPPEGELGAEAAPAAPGTTPPA